MKKCVWILLLVIALFVAGCAKEEADVTDSGISIASYMASVKEQSDGIKTALEEALTQVDMNEKSQELYALWDGTMQYLLEECKRSLPEEEFAQRQAEQDMWATEREKAVEEAGKEVEGGSIYPLVVNMEAARLTEARAYELYELLQEAENG